MYQVKSLPDQLYNDKESAPEEVQGDLILVRHGYGVEILLDD